MFSKLKLKKAPLSLSSVSNIIKTSGISNLSPESLNPKTLGVAINEQFGLPKNSITAIAYDPIQSLLAVATTNNDVRVYGQKSVEVVFEFNTSSPMTELRFIKGIYLVGILPGGSGITVLSLHSKSILGTFLPSGTITAIDLDPSLDFLIVGLSNGSVVFYDVDRLALTPFRIDNLQKKIMPKQKMSLVLGIEWHPRDIGTILITYSHCAIIYSLTTGEIKSSLIYQISREAKGFSHSLNISNGGKKKLFGSSKEVIVPLLEAHFHPNGLHVVTVHKDNTLSFWDGNDGTLLEARNLFETNLQKPGEPIETPINFAPIENVRWVCSQDPELTQLVICGGDSQQGNLIHILDFGYTLKYSLTSHEKQGQFYSQPSSGQRIIPITLNNNTGSEPEYISKILPVPIDSLPYFGGNHNPSFLMMLSNIGSLYISEYSSSGEPPSDMSGLILPLSLSLVEPPVISASIITVRRIDWYSILSTKASSGGGASNSLLLKGGAPVSHRNAPRPTGYDDSSRNILVTGHEGGIVRLKDISRGEYQEDNLIQISLRDTLYDNGDPNSLSIVDVSLGLQNKEMLVGMGNGDVVICKFGKINIPHTKGSSSGIDYRSCPVQHSNSDGKIYNIKDRVVGMFARSSTFLPVSLLRLDNPEHISCLKMSNVGFAAIGYKSGKMIVCDISRGPAIIYNLDSIKKHLITTEGDCYITTMEFAIMEYGQDGYSSVILLCGTNGGGNLMTFKIIPQGNGGFEVVFMNKTTNLNYRVLGGEDARNSKLDKLIPINSSNGESAVASMEMFQKLSHGIVIPGMIITTSNRDIRVLQLPKTKLSHKVIDESCLACGVIKVKDKGIVLASLVKLGFIKFSSIPSLNDIADVKLPKEVYNKLKNALNSEISSQSDILITGEMLIRLGPTEGINLSAYISESKEKKLKEPHATDLLFNENAIIPPRPAAGAIQWAKGQTRYISSADLIGLIAGPNRRPTKNIESELAHNISPEANPNAGYGFQGYLSDKPEKDYKDPVRRATGPGYGYGMGAGGLMRNLQSGVESMEETVNGYANNMSESMNESLAGLKKAVFNAALKNKLGL
mmetsp:Transcript_7656/g.9671  ORF Transcript_7656/g.9671 Transcript_7656/m.9671 type:complete len:1077 (+) Transcript_7656:23-3253(+)